MFKSNGHDNFVKLILIDYQLNWKQFSQTFAIHELTKHISHDPNISNSHFSIV